MTSTERAKKRHRAVVTMVGDKTILGRFMGELEVDEVMRDLDAAAFPGSSTAVRFPTEYNQEITVNVTNALYWSREAI